MDVRGVPERFLQNTNADLSFGTCGDQILIAYGRLSFAKKSTSNVGRPDPVITAARPMDGSRGLGPIH